MLLSLWNNGRRRKRKLCDKQILGNAQTLCRCRERQVGMTQERLDLCNLSNYKLSTWTWTFLDFYTKVTTIAAEESAIINKQCTCINSALPMGLSAFVAWLVGVGIGANSFTFSPEPESVLALLFDGVGGSMLVTGSPGVPIPKVLPSSS